MNKMASVFREKNFTKLFLAAFTSQMGGTIGLLRLCFICLTATQISRYMRR
ncbi:hypothetical protein SAMN05443252_101106 [Bacillus sp. OV322]|nr:hypothetical protein SAMN05443252_101106 [Bacillus sp. OV322]